MPVDNRSRAAASIAQPLDAEVLADGAWRPGTVLGWRHDEAGACEAEVRVAVSGVERVQWVELAAVRLPEVAGPASPGSASPGRGSAPEPPAATVVMSRAELRELMATGLPARGASRRRRHASDLTAELPVVRCAETAATPGTTPGRHRAPAPAGAGRHRAHDDAATEVVTRATTGGVAGAVAGGVTGGPGAPDLMTRPIRLGDVAGWPWSGTPSSSS